MTTKEKIKIKLALNEVNCFLKGVNGLSEGSVISADEIDLTWHLKLLGEINSYHKKISPINRIDLSDTSVSPISWIDENIGEVLNKECYIYFNEYFFIKVVICELKDFLKCFHKHQGNWDISLFFLNPEKIYVICDNEYDMCYYKYINNS
ncbi:hypothetical protein [Vibrio metschnikovii]|uniref:hypothetical protein n=1 Tax=Vibrio metschnikovii TaxID=28172 RepID=UPI002FC77923